MNKYEREQAIQDARNSLIGYSIAVSLGRIETIYEEHGLGVSVRQQRCDS